MEQRPITERIDNDEGLGSKRKQLTIVSLILLGINLTGAKIVEANTFVFKIEFENTEGLTTLLMLSIIFLILRYYNYATTYHSELKRLWVERMLSDKATFFHLRDFDNEPGEFGRGLITDLAPNEFVRAYEHFYHLANNQNLAAEYDYIPSLSPSVLYYWDDKDHGYPREELVHVPFFSKTNLVLQILESKYQVMSLLKNRENLDILAPYLIGFLALTYTLA